MPRFHTNGAALALSLVFTGAVVQSDRLHADTIGETVADQSSAFAIVTLLLKTSGLYETLNAEGPYTLFAPTDEAFAKLPDEVMAALLDPANAEALRTVLQNHVAGEALAAGAFIDQTREVETLAGRTLSIEGDGELYLQQTAAPYVSMEDGKTVVEFSLLESSVPKVTITDAGGGALPGGDDDDVQGAVVVLPDLTADNGVIHAISEVLIADGMADGL